MFGVLLINKPQGMTSHDVVYRVRKILGTKKVGHAGTLDPLATGLLVLAVGPATRFLRYLELEPKEYQFTVAFGRETMTYDAEGETVKESPVPEDLEQVVKDNLLAFIGDIRQIPPMYSAVKKEGKPLYAYARKGETVEREQREVTVYSFESAGPARGAHMDFRCVCSSGTYVRTLAHDLGRLVGCGAHVSALTRTRVGRFHLADAVGLDNVTADALIPLVEALEPMPTVRLTEGQLYTVLNGAFLRVREAPNEPLVALTDPEGQVVSVARVVENELHPECVVSREALHGAV